MACDRPTLRGALLNLSLKVFPSYGPAVIVRSMRTTLRGDDLLLCDGPPPDSLFSSLDEDDEFEEDVVELSGKANFARTSFSFAASSSSNSARV